MRTRISSLALLALFLAACGQTFAFPLKLPPNAARDKNYRALKHELAENRDYHFTILVPNDWKTLATSIAKEPLNDKPLELAVFREPGAWMTSESAPIQGEIVIEVFSLTGSTLTAGKTDEAPIPWLLAKLKETLGTFTVLQQRSYTSLYGPAADVLIQVGTGDAMVVSRMAAYRSPKDPKQLFAVVCSALAKGYNHIADDCITAIGTFRLENQKRAPTPLPKESTGALKM